jgi:hypothetical protein
VNKELAAQKQKAALTRIQNREAKAEREQEQKND